MQRQWAAEKMAPVSCQSELLGSGLCLLGVEQAAVQLARSRGGLVWRPTPGWLRRCWPGEMRGKGRSLQHGLWEVACQACIALLGVPGIGACCSG